MATANTASRSDTGSGARRVSAVASPPRGIVSPSSGSRRPPACATRWPAWAERRMCDSRRVAAVWPLPATSATWSPWPTSSSPLTADGPAMASTTSSSLVAHDPRATWRRLPRRRDARSSQVAAEAWACFSLPAPGAATGDWELIPVAHRGVERSARRSRLGRRPSDGAVSARDLRVRQLGPHDHAPRVRGRRSHRRRRRRAPLARRSRRRRDLERRALGRDQQPLRAHVFVYEHASLAGAEAAPVGILRGVTYPHGLRFAGGDERLLVADAGAPHVHVFAASTGVARRRLPGRDDRRHGRRDLPRGPPHPEEGGPKGLDLDPRTNMLLVTSEETPLSCFDAGAIVERPWEMRRDDDAFVLYELHALAAAAEHMAGRTCSRARRSSRLRQRLAAELAGLRATKTWRLTQPPRTPTGRSVAWWAGGASPTARGARAPLRAARRPARPREQTPPRGRRARRRRRRAPRTGRA